MHQRSVVFFHRTGRLSTEFSAGLQMELYANDSVLMVESLKLVKEKKLNGKMVWRAWR